MSLIPGHGPVVTDDDLEDWILHLDRMAPILDLLEERGLSRGEALIVIELNSVSSHLVDIKKSMYEGEEDGYQSS